MTSSHPRRADGLRRVLVFVISGWSRGRDLVAGIAAAITAATLADVFLPFYAGRLVDSLDVADRIQGLRAGLPAFATMTGLSLVALLLRHVAWSLVVPLTLRTMADMARSGFARVQRFSTEWHANTFAGSTVRKITRGMWALDELNDTLLLSFLPSLVVLVETMAVLGARWPAMGGVIAIGTVV